MSVRILSVLIFALSALSAQAEVTLVACNGGAFKITAQTPRDRFVTGTITDLNPNVVSYYVGESQKSQTVKDTNGQYSTVVTGLPFGVVVTSAPRTIVIKDMQFQPLDSGYATGGPAGVQFKPFAQGGDLTMVNGKMTSSHSQAIWMVGNWYFDHCVYPTPRQN